MTEERFLCDDGSLHFVRGWEKCVEDCDKRPGFLTVRELLSFYPDLYKFSRISCL